MRRGLLLINLGTPSDATTSAVRSYLREFLSDPRVLDIPKPLRWLLLYGVILPLRSPKSAEAYQKVWTDEGSPLLVHSKNLVSQLRTRLPLAIELGMRYGQPSIRAALERLRQRGCDEVIVAPLYPQYASSSTGSCLEVVYREAAKLWNTPFLRVLPPFYDDDGFLEAFAQVGQPVLYDQSPGHVLFSFHGLPERHITKSDGGGYCFSALSCCDKICEENVNCYRAQCFATARGIAAKLKLEPDDWSVSFQSRLGRTPWIQPYTDLRLVELAESGVKSVAVFCPAFVADCLETLEEIGMRAVEDFRAAGGDELRLVPSLNEHPAWVEALVALIEPFLLDSPAAPAPPAGDALQV